MRPSVVLSILTPLLLVAGGVLFALASWRGGEIASPLMVSLMHVTPSDVSRAMEPRKLASILLLIGAACGMLWIAIVRRQCREFSRTIHKMSENNQLRQVHCDNPVLRPLVINMNNLVELAEQAVADAKRQVKELEIQLRVVTAERQDAQAILHSISDAVIVTDPFDELVIANEAAGRALDFDPDRACGLPVDKVLKDAKMIELVREMRQSRGTGRRVVEHVLRAEENGQTIEKTFKITLSCVSEEPEGPAGVVTVLHDMTREKEVARMKNDFVSNVSHELRTPLASIKAYVEMLIDGEAEDKKTEREFHEVIQGEANRLSRLIDNILSISRIESGLVQVNKRPQSLTVILKEAIEVIAPQARTKQINIVEKLTPVFYQTLADKDMLYQAVLNLLSNAVKYTPVGGTVTIETLVDEGAGKVLTKITDSGVGIPPKDLPHVFDKFFRSDANKHMAQGTGLGLSLVKHMIETAHKGRLFVESRVGKGSCFGFELLLTK